jgi:hypothetical protein
MIMDDLGSFPVRDRNSFSLHSIQRGSSIQRLLWTVTPEVIRPELEVDHSRRSSTEVCTEMSGILSPFPLYGLMVWCLDTEVYFLSFQCVKVVRIIFTVRVSAMFVISLTQKFVGVFLIHRHAKCHMHFIPLIKFFYSFCFEKVNLLTLHSIVSKTELNSDYLLTWRNKLIESLSHEVRVEEIAESPVHEPRL